MDILSNIFDHITMHRLTLYCLIVLALAAGIFSLSGVLSFSFIAFIFSLLFLLAVTTATNYIFARVYSAHTNLDSTLISALILSLIITPARSVHELGFLFWAAVWTSASKYIFALNNKHIFNPVALGAVMISLAFNYSATWWVGTLPMLPFVLMTGFLILYKIKHNGLVLSFFITAIMVISVHALLNGHNLTSLVYLAVIDTPLLFFGFIMLTEPITLPPTLRLQLVYGILAGLFFAPQLHLGSFYLTPEIAIILVNIYSYLAGPKFKLLFRNYIPHALLPLLKRM